MDSRLRGNDTRDGSRSLCHSREGGNPCPKFMNSPGLRVALNQSERIAR